ncbi:phage portal protein [Massilia sp. YIM B02763]|uniref:phage portal protein n=1 Tax=Massilia sp. YIM B02763 TaxID=3050130 RepID=UPI0025B70CCE|nr:phage portal protein [Massilia sp. YIM B02763]MDN4052895.1 phage portal protein [Massilia sp. YIM B02763]
MEMFDALEATKHWRVEKTYRPQDGATLIKSSDPQIVAMLGSAPAASGFAVTSETALRVSAVYASVRLLAGAVASIPVSVIRETEDGRESISPDLWWLLNEQPIENWTAASMWEWVVQSICLRGDGFVEIVRRGASVKALRPHHPDLVHPIRSGDGLIYLVTDENSVARPVHQDDMLHFAGFGFNGTRSMSVIQWAAFQSIGIALATDALSGNFYANGAAPKHVIQSDSEMDDEQIEQLRNEYKRKYAGVNNAGLPLVLTEGLNIKEMSMTSVDAQLLESRKFQVIDIARAFGVPPHMIGAQETTSSWGTGIEQMSIGFIRWSLQPYINRIRQELNRKLFRRASPFVEHKMEALLAGDSKAEGEYFRQAIGGSQGPGWMTINEVRKAKSLPPIDGGNKLYRPEKGSTPEPKGKKDDEAVGTTDPE